MATVNFMFSGKMFKIERQEETTAGREMTSDTGVEGHYGSPGSTETEEDAAVEVFKQNKRIKQEICDQGESVKNEHMLEPSCAAIEENLPIKSSSFGHGAEIWE